MRRAVLLVIFILALVMPAGPALAGAVIKGLAAQNTYSNALQVEAGHFNFSIYGTWAGTVTLQRSFDGGNTWLDVGAYTENTELAGYEPEGALYRAGIKTGEYTSGQANVRIGQ